LKLRLARCVPISTSGGESEDYGGGNRNN